MDEAIETLQLCLRVLDMANRVDGMIENKRYFSALRSLEELSTIHLKPVLHHEFARHMLDSIPAMREQIRTAVTREMREWLFEVREKGRLVGQLALDAMEARQKRWKVKSGKDAMLSLAKVNSPIELVVNERVECKYVFVLGCSPTDMLHKTILLITSMSRLTLRHCTSAFTYMMSWISVNSCKLTIRRTEGYVRLLVR